MIEREIVLPPYRFWERRSGSGTPIVLIHGLGGSADWWRRNVEELSEDHTVSAVDLVGFGRNRFFLRRSSLPLTFVEIAALLARWIRTSFDEPVHLVGNSMGGHIALHLTAEQPDLVRSLTLVNATGIPFELSPRAHLDNFVVPRGALSFATVIARDAFRSGPTALAVAFARLLRDDARPLLREITVPTLLLWGERDPLVPLSYGRQMEEAIPNAKLIVIPHAGHIPMWENPDAFNRALLTFIHEVERSERPAGVRPIFGWGLSGWTSGMAHRQAGTRRDIVLVHGLGMSSAYFSRFARALYARGWDPIAPDLPGFGQSLDGKSASPSEHAAILARWADELQIRDAVWLGHSIACDAVAHLADVRPDLCRATVMMGPLWTRHRSAVVRLLFMLLLDGFREPMALYRDLVAAYWRTGFARWLGTFRKYARGFTEERRRVGGAPQILLCGHRDPLPDRTTLKLTEIAGAHACHFSHPDDSAVAVESLRR